MKTAQCDGPKDGNGWTDLDVRVTDAKMR